MSTISPRVLDGRPISGVARFSASYGEALGQSAATAAMVIRMFSTTKFAWRHRVIAIAIAAFATILTACGGGAGGSDAADSPSATTAATSGAASGNGAPADGANPFSGLVECLQEQGLEVTEPTGGGPGRGGSRPNGSLPPDFSVPEGGLPPDGSLPPDFSVPEGGRPDGSFPGAGGNQDPAFIASILGLDSSDPDVTAAIETCSDQLG